jgi:transcriptional regulator of acetoin/glycerol metabolism
MSGGFSSILQEDAFEFLMAPENLMKQSELEFGASILSIKEMERVLLLRALKLSHGNRTQAARILGVARSTLFEMLKRHKIKGPKMGVLDE